MGGLAGLSVLLLAALVATVAVLLFVAGREVLRPPRHTTGYALAHGLPADPGDLGLGFDEWSMTLPGGAALAVWEVAGRRRGPAPTAVFVHDWGESRLESLRRIEPWPDLATRLVLYDLRGHGESGGTSRLGRGEERDLLALLDRLGEGPFVLAGRGLGARIAAAAATRAAPGRVRALVLSLHDRRAEAPVLDRLHRLGCPAALAASALAILRLVGVRPPPAVVAASMPCPVLETGDADVPASAERLRELLSPGSRAAPR